MEKQWNLTVPTVKTAVVGLPMGLLSVKDSSTVLILQLQLSQGELLHN